MTNDHSVAPDRKLREDHLRQVLGDGILTQLIAEFSEAFAFLRIRWTRFAEEVHPELKGGTLALLNTIVKRGPITATELGQLLTLDKGLVSRQVTHLKELGFIDSAPSDDDRRIVFLSATASARETIDRIHVHLAGAYEERLASWSADELEDLVAALQKFNETNHEIADVGSHQDGERAQTS